MKGHPTLRWGALAGVAVLAAAVHLAGCFEWAERHLMDLRFSLLRRPVAGEVVVVAIDPRSLESLDVWPWPRGYHATVLENLLSSGARRIAFDLDLSSRSIEEEDRALEQALGAAEGRVVLPIFQQWQLDPRGMHRLVTTRPLRSFAAHAELATINVRPEKDGRVRRYGAAAGGAGPPHPPLARALHAPLDGPAGEFYVDYGLDVASIPQISYVDALTGRFDPGLVAGRDVIIGATAVELGDQVPAPVYTTLSGPILQALAVESLAAGRELRRLPAPMVSLACLLLVLVVGPLLLRASWRAGAGLAALSGAVLFVLSLTIQRLSPLMVDVAPLAAAVAGCYGLALVRRIDHLDVRLLLESLRTRDSERRMRHVVEHCSEAIITVDEEQRVETFNRAAEAMFGRPAAEVIGAGVDQIIPGGLRPPGDSAAAAEAPRDAGAAWRGEVTLARGDGRRLILALTVSDLSLEGRRLRVVFLTDVTDSKRQQADLEHQATHDPLTGLPNRAMLQGRLEEALRGDGHAPASVALLLLDLDRFKEVNDALGHETGDLLLRQIAMRLGQPLRPGDTIARLGGDEFAMLLPGSDRAEAQQMAGRLIEALRASFEIRGMGLQVDASIGIAISPEHGADAATLVQRADVAMYLAKRTRNTYRLYDPVADLNSVRHLTLTGEMRRAMEEERFVLHYQPKIDLATGSPAGVEALLRWPHPRHGFVAPSEFIPLAERTGLIKPLTRWVLTRALAQGAAWRREGLSLTVSVNCSARNLLEPDLPEAIERALHASGIAPESLILEITETALIEDPTQALEILRALASLGVRISIDDFGTAYSSLDYLRKLPASELKIDRSFVSRLDQNGSDAMIVGSTIRLAHDFGLKAVAEGIESRTIIARLTDLGCDQGQGYFISPPLPHGELSSWMLRFLVPASRHLPCGATAAR